MPLVNIKNPFNDLHSAVNMLEHAKDTLGKPDTELKSLLKKTTADIVEKKINGGGFIEDIPPSIGIGAIIKIMAVLICVVLIIYYFAVVVPKKEKPAPA